jgi:hypothetical protein
MVQSLVIRSQNAQSLLLPSRSARPFDDGELSFSVTMIGIGLVSMVFTSNGIKYMFNLENVGLLTLTTRIEYR